MPSENSVEVHERRTLTAVLFVGGLSRRMGADKATLQFEGEPLWARQVRLLRELNPDVLWISARTRPEWCPAEIEVVMDEAPSRGPLSGLAAALQRVQTSHLLALAIDMPRMTAEPLHRLWPLAKRGCGVVPVCNDLLEPLCAIYPMGAATDAAAALRSGSDVSLQTFVHALCRENRVQMHPVGDAEKSFFQNVNTLRDLEACLSRRH